VWGHATPQRDETGAEVYPYKGTSGVALSLEAGFARGMMKAHVCCVSQLASTSIIPLRWLHAFPGSGR
jgi:hypothetical protein